VHQRRGIEGDHLIPVSKDPSKMTDPRNVRFKTNSDHKEKTRIENSKPNKNCKTCNKS
jgi:hypothetical protein